MVRTVTMTKLARKLIWLSGSSFLGLAMLPAMAQAPADTNPAVTTSADEILVTGSRIPRANLATIEPTSVIDAKRIDALGYTNLADALNELPQFGVADNGVVGAQGNGFNTGQTFINLYGLGSQRTLTLVEGRRFVSSNTPSAFGPAPGSQVDLNVIPETLVDRTDVLSVGGAPLYGADAIAGTVNIRLKHDFQGFEVRAQNGISQRGDGASHRISAIAGTDFAEGRGHIVVSGEWNKDAGLTTADRALTSSASGPFFAASLDPDAPFAEQLYYGQRLTVLNQYGTPMFYDLVPQVTGITNASGNPLTFNAAGRLVPFDYGAPTGSALLSAGGNGFNIGDYGSLRTGDQRYLATALGSFHVFDALRFFGEGWYSHSRATQLVNDPYYNSLVFGQPAGAPTGNLILSIDNPFLNPSDRAMIASQLFPGQDSFYLSRANTDLQTGRTTSTVSLYRFVGGAEGDISLLGKPWHYEASLNYGHSRTINQTRAVVFQNLQNALDAIAGPNGTIVCAPGYTNAPIATGSGACAPFDPFGQSNTAIQRAAIDYITAKAQSTSINTQFVADLNTHGTIATLPGGDIKMSIGYEHRRESASFDPGAFYAGQTLADGTREAYGNAVPIDAVSGAYHTDEGFAELRVPLVSPQMDVPLVHSAEIEAAARYVDNSIAGAAWTYTAGGIFAPVADLTFRGNYTRSIRAPAITEAFNPTSSAFVGGSDPCDQRFLSSGPNPARRGANCAAAGLPANFASNYVDVGVPATISGNPNLRNERADSYTFGAVIRPRYIPGLSISADYVAITVKDAIVQLDGDAILDACYDAAAFPSSFCNLVTRNSSGQISMIKEGFYNAAVRKLKAVQANVTYTLDLHRLGLGENAGAVTLAVDYYHVIDQYTRIGVGDIDHSTGEIGNPVNSYTANLGFARGGLALLWQTQYFGPSVFDADAPASLYQYPGVKHWYLFNASIGYTIDKNYDIRLIVNNVLDTRPPFPSPAGSGLITYYSGLLGRYMKVSAGVKF
jgi:iron complex outermembrane receptor protein